MVKYDMQIWKKGERNRQEKGDVSSRGEGGSDSSVMEKAEKRKAEGKILGGGEIEGVLEGGYKKARWKRGWVMGY